MKKLFNTLASTAIGDKVVCSCEHLYAGPNNFDKLKPEPTPTRKARPDIKQYLRYHVCDSICSLLPPRSETLLHCRLLREVAVKESFLV